MNHRALVEVENLSVLFPLYHGSSRSLKKMVVAAASGRLAKDQQQRDDRYQRLHQGPRLERLADAEPEVLLDEPESSVVHVREHQRARTGSKDQQLAAHAWITGDQWSD